MCPKLAYALVVDAAAYSNNDDSEMKTTTTTTTKSIEGQYLELRRVKTTKDADLIIKMTGDFIKDMQQKMLIIRRIESNYDASADYMIGSSYDDIQRHFKRMCDLYKQFASVERYVLGKELNDTAPNWDVVVLYQVMLSDYNEIMMLMELLKVEQRLWSTFTETDFSRDLIKKQLEKLPARVVEDSAPNARRWVRGRGAKSDYPQKWSGELDGVGFDNR